MRSCDDPSSLTHDERFSEIAAILAGGVLRLHARSALSGDDVRRGEGESPMFVGRESGQSPESPDFAPEGLEVSEETVLSVHCG